MKSLKYFIVENEIENLNEGLLSKLTGWFKSLFKSQETLEDKTIKVDTKNVKGPDKSAKLTNIESNKEELNLINHDKVGFPLISTIIKQKNKYLVKETPDGNKQEYKPLIDRYFYIDGNNKYDVGMVMYDCSISNDNNYVNMLGIEVIDSVENKQEVLKFIHDVFENKLKKNKYQGSQYIITLPKMKGILNSLGYKSENNNTNILFKNFK